jgi:hypothetical protein
LKKKEGVVKKDAVFGSFVLYVQIKIGQIFPFTRPAAIFRVISFLYVAAGLLAIWVGFFTFVSDLGLIVNNKKFVVQSCPNRCIQMPRLGKRMVVMHPIWSWIV